MTHPNKSNDDPRDVHPRQARRMFLKSKRGEIKASAARAYEFPTKHFVSYLENNGIESMQSVDGFLIEQWKNARKDEDIKPVTYKSTVKHVKTFIGYCERSSLLDHGTFEGIKIPNIPDSKEASNEKIEPSVVTSISDYLETYEYATRRHALFEFIWETGCRISGAMSIDVDDIGTVGSEEYYVEFKNRPNSGTPLKNDKKSERRVTLSKSLYELIQDYLAIHRPDLTDEYNREALFNTETKRITRSRAYKDITALTRPCVYTGNCPHSRDIRECDPGRVKKRAYGCPSSRSLHPIRRGSITYHLNQGWPKEKVSERCDVGLDVLEKHYNEQTKEDERKQRLKYVEKLN